MELKLSYLHILNTEIFYRDVRKYKHVLMNCKLPESVALNYKYIDTCHSTYLASGQCNKQTDTLVICVLLPYTADVEITCTMEIFSF